MSGNVTTFFGTRWAKAMTASPNCAVRSSRSYFRPSPSSFALLIGHCELVILWSFGICVILLAVALDAESRRGQKRGRDGPGDVWAAGDRERVGRQTAAEQVVAS